MTRTLTTIVALLIVGTIAAFAQIKTETFYLSQDQKSIQERITGDLSQPILTLDELTDTIPSFYPHMVGQKLVNERFHRIAVAPGEKHIAFTSGEVDQWLGIIDTEKRTYNFILFGLQTHFIDMAWSQNGYYLAYAFAGPDRRLVLHMIAPPAPGEVKPMPMNGWQYAMTGGEGLRFKGWKPGKEPSFAFDLIDKDGKTLEKFDLPLHRPAQPIPPARKPSGK